MASMVVWTSRGPQEAICTEKCWETVMMRRVSSRFRLKRRSALEKHLARGVDGCYWKKIKLSFETDVVADEKWKSITIGRAVYSGFPPWPCFPWRRTNMEQEQKRTGNGRWTQWLHWMKPHVRPGQQRDRMGYSDYTLGTLGRNKTYWEGPVLSRVRLPNAHLKKNAKAGWEKNRVWVTDQTFENAGVLAPVCRCEKLRPHDWKKPRGIWGWWRNEVVHTSSANRTNCQTHVQTTDSCGTTLNGFTVCEVAFLPGQEFRNTGRNQRMWLVEEASGDYLGDGLLNEGWRELTEMKFCTVRVMMVAQEPKNTLYFSVAMDFARGRGWKNRKTASCLGQRGNMITRHAENVWNWPAWKLRRGKRSVVKDVARAS